MPLSVVIPVYRGEKTLAAVVGELAPYTSPTMTPGGIRYRIADVVLVHDNGPDQSDRIMRDLAALHPFVKVVWLSRNFGQHAATIAGIARAEGRWIVTMDEDGQHDPAAIGDFLDAATAARAGVVYADFTNASPHGLARAAASRNSKRLLGRVFGTPDSTKFQSYRMIRADMARQLASFAKTGVYFDVALSWVTNRVVTVPTTLRSDDERVSSYRLGSLLAYFWRMVLTSGTRGLRIVSITGALLAAIGVVLAIVLVIAVASGANAGVEGWSSLMVALLICTGAILGSLGVIAEYIGVSLNVAMGRPLYLVVDDPETVMVDEGAPTLPLDSVVSGGMASDEDSLA
ncbi:glycosyltransferase [Humibacter sp. BT305]|nr:glycosyltransferase [Humibacter sp. BT305]